MKIYNYKKLAKAIEIEFEFRPFSTPSIADPFSLTFCDILFPAEPYQKLFLYCSIVVQII